MVEHSYPYPRPMLTVDLIALRWRKGTLEVALIKRASDPFMGQLALPGGFVDQGESPRSAAVRELEEETQLQVIPSSLLEVGAFAEPNRDPRGWCLSIAFMAFLPANAEMRAGDDAAETHWMTWCSLQSGVHSLAFDHQEILHKAAEQLKQSMLTEPRALTLLGTPFRSRHARQLYNQVWDRPLAPRPFKAWLRAQEVLTRVGKALYSSRPSFKRPW